jgi:hypothetical protein
MIVLMKTSRKEGRMEGRGRMKEGKERARIEAMPTREREKMNERKIK